MARNEFARSICNTFVLCWKNASKKDHIALRQIPEVLVRYIISFVKPPRLYRTDITAVTPVAAPEHNANENDENPAEASVAADENSVAAAAAAPAAVLSTQTLSNALEIFNLPLQSSRDAQNSSVISSYPYPCPTLQVSVAGTAVIAPHWNEAKRCVSWSAGHNGRIANSTTMPHSASIVFEQDGRIFRGG